MLNEQSSRQTEYVGRIKRNELAIPQQLKEAKIADMVDEKAEVKYRRPLSFI